YNANDFTNDFQKQIFPYHAIPMASTSTLLADLRAGRCSNTAEVCLLRFLEARNINKGGELMSVDMLLLDENSTLVHGSVSVLRQLRFRNKLTKGSDYSLSGLAMSVRNIPTEHFCFQPYDQILELANTGKQLPDVMGELCAIRSTITNRIPGAQRVMLTLRLGRDSTVCVSLFDSLAHAFHGKLDCYGREPRIFIATDINPKMVAGKLYLNGTSATRLYFDSESAVGKAELDRRVLIFYLDSATCLPGGGIGQSASSSKVVHAQKIEPLNVSELNQFVVTAEPQIIEFLCTAKVSEIHLGEGWCHIGCSNCSKKLIREETSFKCVPCNEANAVAELRYRVILSVTDGTGTATFLGFDTEVAKLTHVLASEAAQIVGVGATAQVDVDLPRSLADLVGNTYTFQLKLTDFNFNANHQTYTISRIFLARELAPIPTFYVSADVTEPALLQNVAAGPEGIAAITSNVAEHSPGADGTIPQREVVATEEADLAETVTAIASKSGSRAGRYKWDLVACSDCQAIVWNAEAVVQDTHNSPSKFSICCQQGRVKLPPRRQPPSPLKELLETTSFKIQIRVANGMLTFTSMGGQIDNTVINTPGPFAFRLHGQTHHKIASLLPPEGKPQQFSQLYIVDTDNELANIKKAFNKGTSALTEFPKWVLDVGNGTAPTVKTEGRSHEDGEQVIIEDEFMIP
ncbi:hypothetical protein IGI04_026058, partial [Brassica rapa subsp. trilocularis]